MDQDLISKKVLFVQVKSPENIVFEGEADAITSVNERGRFDVLPFHANFISIIKDVLVVREKGGKMNEIKIDGGVIKANENKIFIFLGIEAFKENIVVDAAQKNPSK